MSRQSILFQDVWFAYDTAASQILAGFSVHFPHGWTGIAGANGSGKSTVLKLAAGELTPQRGQINSPGHTVYCPQRTDDPPGNFNNFINQPDKEAYKIKGRLGIQDDWPDRWATLSHGERKRAQIAAALWLQPQVLAVDEPLNHLDQEARDMVAGALRSYSGIGLLVSHDRELLDALCQQCLFLEPPEAIMRPGNYSKGRDQAQREEAYRHEQRTQAKRTLSKLKRETSRRRNAASQADKKRSKRGMAAKDHDARSKIDLARVTGKDGSAGKQLRQLDGQLRQAQDKLNRVKVKKEYEMGIWLSGSQARCDTLFTLAAGSLPLGEEGRLVFPDLAMRPGDRIALTGANGSGKSTLIRYIMESMDRSRIRTVYLPQEVDIAGSKQLIDEVRTLSDQTRGRLMQIVSRLGSRPHRLLESTEPSPGEVRKILLAMGIAREPNLIVMDEPTNHMDLPSIECLENALSDCPCGLLLVSHDRRFLDRLTRSRWHIIKKGQTDFELSGPHAGTPTEGVRSSFQAYENV
jgi:ATPase subunit of ABC transporter with duplicated ATPase domains